jgi:hypothetical protein
MRRVRVVCFDVWSSKGGSHHLCRLRTNRLSLVNKIEYVLVNTGFIGSCKLCSFDSHQVG